MWRAYNHADYNSCVWAKGRPTRWHTHTSTHTCRHPHTHTWPTLKYSPCPLGGWCDIHTAGHSRWGHDTHLTAVNVKWRHGCVKYSSYAQLISLIWGIISLLLVQMVVVVVVVVLVCCWCLHVLRNCRVIASECLFRRNRTVGNVSFSVQCLSDLHYACYVSVLDIPPVTQGRTKTTHKPW